MFWALLALQLVSCVGLLVFVMLREPKINNAGVYANVYATFTWLGFWFTAGYQLYRLFGNLAAGAIYTRENVRRVRNVGLLWLLFAVLGVVVPVTLDVARQLIDGFTPNDFRPTFKFALTSSFGLLKSFVSAGLVLLASWIMHVGLYEKERADALRRDADLVI